jgi:hypothetical protein
MATSVAGLMANVQAVAYNPSAIQRAVLQTLSDVSSGALVVVDPTSPFVFALESSATLTATAMSEDATLTRKQYPYAAQLLEDLYLHMSDEDYINRFAVPATSTFYMMLPYDELLNKLVLDPTTGIKYVTIPRNTYITVADTTFSIQYPILIQQLQHGGLQVVYDTSELSPLQTLSSNQLTWNLVSDGTTTYLQFAFEVMQFDIASTTKAVNASALFQYQFSYTDQFYYCRVYSENADGTWTEMQTTHTPEIYDVTTPTAVLEVLDDNILQVSIPQIYTATGVLNSTIRIDIYTTQGQINLALDNYSMGAFTTTFYAVDANDNTPYTAPLQTLSAVFSYCTSVVSGGSDGTDFATLQQQVINNSVGPQQAPISNLNLEAALTELGYTVVTNIDNITNRTFLATKGLPVPTDSDLTTPAGTMNATVSLTLDQIAANSYVIDNTSTADAMTLTPQALYQDVSGVVSLVSDAEIAMLNGLPPDQKALVLTQGGYLYTPFHYVLDSSNNGFAVRPYYLDNPNINTKLFISQNGTTQLQVSVGAYGIVRTPTGYKIQIQTTSGGSFQALQDSQIYVQLAYIPEGEHDRAYLNGTLIGHDSTGKERIYEFDLSSTMNVDANNCIDLTQFMMYTTQERITAAPLVTNFDVIFATTAVMDVTWQPAEVDSVLGRFLLPLNVVGIDHEQLQVQFGTALTTLWARARTVVSTETYQTYQTNVPQLYPNDVYQRDPVTGSAFTIVNGQLEYTILHKAGDVVTDDNGNVQYQYVIGQVVLGPDGQPIVANPRGVTRQVDFMLIEGVYQFATDQAASDYRTQMIDTLLGWLTNDLAVLNDELLENSEMFYYPKTTLGQIDVMVGASQKTTIEAGQSLTLTLYVNASTYGNADLRTQLSETAVTTVTTGLDTTQVSRAAIIDALGTAFGSDVIDVELDGLGSAAQDLPLFTILDGSIRASLRKKLVAQPDNSLILQEDLTIVFVEHDESVISG